MNTNQSEFVPASMKDFVAFMVKHIVNHPEKVQVNEKVGEQTLILEVHLAKPDIGLVIGRHGRVVKSLQTLLVGASRSGKRIILEILE